MAQAAQPNFLWLTIEDISPHWSAYGDSEAQTPNLDKAAKQGVLYRNAFSAAPVCAVTRAGLLTGLYSPAQGTHHMRNNAILSKNVRTYPQLLAAAGYYCTNPGKTDYQGLGGKGFWNGTVADYRARPDKSRPFIHVANFDGTHESNNTGTDLGNFAPSALSLPPYYPATDKASRVWASYRNNIAQMDAWVAARLGELGNSGEAENTIVFIYSDHGAGLPRAKRWLFDSGIRIPLLILIPPKFRRPGKDLPGTVEEELVSTVDLAPTVLHLAGAAVPAWMQGRAFLGSGLSSPRKYVFTSRDRMDERCDIIRGVHDSRFAYIRNYEYFKPRMQYNTYAEANAWSGMTQEIRRIYEAGSAPPEIAWYFGPKPLEELYDTRTDPDMMHDLARVPAQAGKLREMRAALIAWRGEIRDLGAVPEGILLERRGKYGSEYDLGRQVPGQLDTAWAILDSLAYKSAPELAALLGSGDEAVRYWAAIGLGNLKDGSAAVRKAFTAALAEVSPWARIAAARGMLFLGESLEALQALRLGLASQDPTVRLDAALACDELGMRAAALKPELLGVVADASMEYPAQVAKRALATLDGPPDFPPTQVRACPDPASTHYDSTWTIPDERLCGTTSARRAPARSRGLARSWRADKETPGFPGPEPATLNGRKTGSGRSPAVQILVQDR
jgi:uncharacterized sulfatase